MSWYCWQSGRPSQSHLQHLKQSSQQFLVDEGNRTGAVLVRYTELRCNAMQCDATHKGIIACHTASLEQDMEPETVM